MKKNRMLTKAIMLAAITILSSFCLFGCGESESSNALDDMALLDIINKIYETAPVDLNLYTDNMDVTDQDTMSYNTGLINFDKAAEAAISEPMMGSQAYSLVLVRVKDEADVADVAAEMKSGIDQAKWICVAADDLQVVSCGDVILLIMVSSDLADTATSQGIVDAFTQVCGTDVVKY